MRRESNLRKVAKLLADENVNTGKPTTLIAPIGKENVAPRQTAFTMFRASDQRPKAPAPVPQVNGSLRVDIGAYAKELGRAFRGLSAEDREHFQRQADLANAAMTALHDAEDPAVSRAK